MKPQFSLKRMLIAVALIAVGIGILFGSAIHHHRTIALSGGGAFISAGCVLLLFGPLEACLAGAGAAVLGWAVECVL